MRLLFVTTSPDTGLTLACNWYTPAVRAAVLQFSVTLVPARPTSVAICCVAMRVAVDVILLSESMTALAVFVVRLVTVTCTAALELIKPVAGNIREMARSLISGEESVTVFVRTLSVVFVSLASGPAWALI